MEPSADKIRDQLIEANPDLAGRIRTTDQVVTQWCEEHGKSKDALSFEEILTIRALPEWRAAMGLPPL